jgi:hypothetical protein
MLRIGTVGRWKASREKVIGIDKRYVCPSAEVQEIVAFSVHWGNSGV